MKFFSSTKKAAAKSHNALHPVIQGVIVCLAASIVTSSFAETGSAAPPKSAAAPLRMRLLTQAQYVNSISYIFGPDISLEVRFPPLRRTDGLLALDAATTGATTGTAEVFYRAANAVASQVVDEAHRSFLVPCTPKSSTAADKVCAQLFFRKAGRLLYRRPLTDRELAELVNRSAQAADQLKDFYTGLSAVLTGMLISPDFLFVRDRPELSSGEAESQQLDPYSLATRLSLFLWNAAPDEDLLQAAERRELTTQRGLARQIERMLSSPRLEVGMRAFFDDMLALADFDNLAKNGHVYPAFTETIVADAREQLLRTIISETITHKKDYRALFTSRSTFLSPTLAAFYGVPAPAQSWSSYEFPEGNPRAGLLTTVGFLALRSHPARSSATLRGRALREQFLCQSVPNPPPNVDFSALENPDPTLRTARLRINAHLKNPVCAGCHKITDPIGLALEQFDGAGQFRTLENGAPIDASGRLDGKEFADAVGLGKALSENPLLPECLVKRLYEYATGGTVSPDQRENLTHLQQEFAAKGFRLPDLLHTLITSDFFKGYSEPPTRSAAVLN